MKIKFVPTWSIVSALASIYLSVTMAHGALAADRPRPPQSDWADRAFASTPVRAAPGSAVTTADLLGVRDIGAISVSPDGRWLAFSVRQAEMASNDRQLRWFVVHTDHSSAPVALALGDAQAISGFGSGYFPSDPAKWSPDGSRLALRLRHGDRIALVMVDPSTGAWTQVADGASQVDAFTWSKDGVLVFRTGLNMQTYRSDVENEARHGWLLNGRMNLVAARTPSPSIPDCAGGAADPACDRRTLAFAPGDAVRPAQTSEIADLDRDLDPALRVGSLGHGSVGRAGAGLAGGPLVWTETFDRWETASEYPMRRLTTSLPGAGFCANPACQSPFFQAVGWARNGQSVWFIKLVNSRSDPRGLPDQYALYEWKPGASEVRSVWRGGDVLLGCQAAGTMMYCTRESATRPAQVVSIDLDNAETRVLADANADLETRLFPNIERIFLRDKDGNTGFADLVYPNDYKPGHAYPLVLVQYNSYGFLRGGTGGEYPIFPFAAQGYFVMSVSPPYDLDGWVNAPAPSFMRNSRMASRQTANVAYAMEAEVKSLITDGKVDPKKVAITGLSFGADVLNVALRDSDMFSVAIASAMQFDISAYALMPLEMPGRARSMAAFGEHSPLAAPDGEIVKLAWSQHPERLRTPLLINMAQNEAMNGFEGVAMLKAADRPIELRVFPDEGHVKYHPQAFAGIYENNMMWLKFWFDGEEDPRAEFRDQYVRWEAMREKLKAEKAAGADTAH